MHLGAKMNRWSVFIREAEVVIPWDSRATVFYFCSRNMPTTENDWKISLSRHAVILYHLPSTPIFVDSISAVNTLGLGTSPSPPYTISINREIVPNKEKPAWIKIPGQTFERATDHDIHIKVTYRAGLAAATPPAPAPPASTPVPPPAWSSLAADFEKLFLAKESADVAFKIGGEEIPAHKLILATRVPAFERMFASNMEEATSGRIQIDDADASSFKRVLKFVYCGKFPEDLNDSADALLPIADKYGIEDLKDACAAALKSRICRDNVITTLIVAYLCGCPDLKTECIKRLADFDRASLDLEMLEPHPKLMSEVIRFV